MRAVVKPSPSGRWRKPLGSMGRATRFEVGAAEMLVISFSDSLASLHLSASSMGLEQTNAGRTTDRR